MTKIATDNTGIDYTESYSPTRGDNKDNSSWADNDIMGSQKDYLKSLLIATKTSPETGALEREDYYPSADHKIIEGYYQGSVLGNVPLFAPSALFPWGVVDAGQQAEDLNAKAQFALYTKAKTDEYIKLKDNLKNELWIPAQMQKFNELRQTYVRKYGEIKGTIAARYSNDYSALVLLNKSYADAQDEMYDKALANVAEYSGAYKNKDGTVMLPDHYISKDVYDASADILQISHKQNPSLEDMATLLRKTGEIQAAQGIDKAIKPTSDGISQRVIAANPSLFSITAANNVYRLDTVKGLIKGELDALSTDGKTTMGELYYNGIYGNVDENKRPTYAEYKQHFIDLATMGTTTALDKVGNSAYEMARLGFDKEEKVPTIKKQSSTVYIGGKAKQVQQYDITSMAKGNSNVVNFIGGQTKNLRTGDDEFVDSGNYTVTNVYYEDGTTATKAVIKQPDYMTDATGNYITDAQGKYIPNPKANESYEVEFNTVGSTINTNFKLDGLPEGSVKTTTPKTQGKTIDLPVGAIKHTTKETPTAQKTDYITTKTINGKTYGKKADGKWYLIQ